jgi:hypothetical protein
MLGMALTLSSPVRGAPPSQEQPCKTELSATADVRDDGKGIYTDHVDGTRCSFWPLDGSAIAGDFVLHLNYFKSKTSRSASYDLDHPVADSGAIPRGVHSGRLHIKLKGIGSMAVGESRQVIGYFGVSENGTDRALRFAETPGDGSNPINVTRTSSTVWTVENAAGNIGKLWSIGSNGPDTSLGLYNVNVNAVITRL